MLFNGRNSSGKQGLWVTDGTAGGTHEILAGSAAGLDPSGFSVFGSEVLFSGHDAAGHSQLWETDGTAAGTHALTVAGASAAGLAPVDLTALPGAPPVVHPNNLSQVVHANNLALSGSVTGAHNFIDTLNFVASYGDLINAFGTNQQAAQNWYNTREPIETAGRNL